MIAFSLTSERWQKASGIFLDALERTASDREAWVREQCRDETGMAQVVLAMIERDCSEECRTPAAAQADLLSSALERSWPAGLQVGAFRILKHLGSGGMGEVYLAERADGMATQKVAIKRLREEAFNPESKRRFLQERRILARLQHPLIAGFLDAGEIDGGPYAVMEYVDGVPITDYVTRHRLGLRQRLELLIQVVEAISHAHRQLVVHRDIKPGNVLVDSAGVPHLLDFGIAKALSNFDSEISLEDTKIENRAFSMHHAAPEQLRGEASGVSCDVYAVGVLLYQLLCGARPLDLEGLSYGDAERKVLQVTPKAPSRRLSQQTEPDISPAALRGDLDNIVMHALEKDPTRRYSSVEALAADLRRVVERRPISLRVDHRWYRLQRFMQRNTLPVSLASVLAIALVAGAWTLYLQSQAVQRERDQAQSALNLLTEAFRSANPLGIADGEITARQILDASRQALGDDLSVAPAQRTELALTLAEVELAIGRNSDAAKLVALALPDIDALDSQRHEQARRVIARVALANNDQDLFEEQLAWARQRGQAETLAWRVLQARYLTFSDQVVASLELLQSLEADLALDGSVDGHVLDARRLHAQSLALLGRNDEALIVISDLLHQQLRRQSQTHPQVLFTRLLRLGSLRASGAYQEALDEALKLQPEIEEVFGSASTMSAALLSTTGTVWSRLEDWDNAASTMEQALNAWVRSTSEDHPNTLRTRFNLAGILQSSGQPAAAEPHYRMAMEGAERALGQYSHLAMYWRLSLAQNLIERRPSEALDLALAVPTEQFSNRPDWMREEFREVFAKALGSGACATAEFDKSARCDAARLLTGSLTSKPPP